MSGEKSHLEHEYHAEAHALSGHLHHPVEQAIKPQAFVRLEKHGGYLSERARDYRLEGVFSFSHSYTQVAGNRDQKPEHGWNTLATAVIEDFNVLDVVTADRIVSQISTDHPLDGYVPTVTFLGTRFENLRIGGKEVEVDLDLDFLGPKPPKDAPYAKDSGFRSRVDKQYARFRKEQKLPPAILGRYNQLPSESKPEASIECSLVSKAEPSRFGRPCGHVIEIPGFGRILLAVLRIEHWDPHKKTGVPMSTKISLTMLEIQMGCIGSGNGSGGNTIVNGAGRGTG
jgi:hypothetical protein